MAETQDLTMVATVPSVIPQKRALEEVDHAPSVPSPLNPDSSMAPKNSRAVKQKTSMAREPREKKESLKKREAKGGPDQGAPRATPDRNATPGAKRKATDAPPSINGLALMRYKLPPPIVSDYEPPRPPLFTLHHTTRSADGSDVRFYESTEQ